MSTHDATSDRPAVAVLQGSAMVLAEVIRLGHSDVARQVVARLEIEYVDLAAVVDEADLEELCKALAR